MWVGVSGEAECERPVGEGGGERQGRREGGGGKQVDDDVDEPVEGERW